MTEEKKLFDKSMEELREAFVRARFAEKDVFGRADVVEWLMQQRQATTPEFSDTSKAWNSYPYKHLADVATGREEEFLRQFASPNHKVPADLGGIGGPINEEHIGRMRDMAEMFLRRDNGRDFYWALNHGPIVDLYFPGSPIYVFACELPNTILRPLTSRDVMEAILASWFRYGNLKARDFMCGAMMGKIAKAQLQAEADFDRAVAVSADGTKIVCADEVLVWVKNPDCPCNFGRFLSFSPTAFFGSNKILLTTHATVYERAHERILVPAPLSVQNTFRCNNHTSSNRDPDRSQLVYKTQNDTRYFVTHERFCPSPLPEGGVELK